MSIVLSRLSIILLLVLQLVQVAGAQRLYDPGPDPNSLMGRELIDLVADIPNMPQLSLNIMANQKFRPAYGPVYWRMRHEPNSVKILFIGQDATHVAEAANRTATAGFGGRAQDLAAYFGVDVGAAFINSSAYTINGQMSAFQTPFILNQNGKEIVKFGNYTDNELWLMMQHPESDWTKWRNKYIDWIIRNNKDSLQMIVTFGGSARDSVAGFIESKGGLVGTAFQNQIADIQIPETALKYAGGNNEFPIVLDRSGKDLYEKMLGRKPDYKDLKTQEEVIRKFTEKYPQLKDEMVFTRGGPLKNGILHPAQLGGHDFEEIYIDGKKTRSLKGLPLSDGTKIKQDLLVLELPHPTFLSNKTPPEASKLVAQKLKVIQEYVKNGFKIEPDPGMENNFAKGESYRYRRSDLPLAHYTQGTPASRMVAVSSASRMRGKNHVIVFGTREVADFDPKTIDKMTEALPSTEFSSQELFTARPRTEEMRYVFDRGPGDDVQKIINKTLNMDDIFKPKSGKSLSKDGIDALNVKISKDHMDYAHYRGSWNNPEVIIISDPHGYDDLITSRAMTGERGQYLQGLMNDMGVADNYLVLRTVPFGMDGATNEEWAITLKNTQEYREQLLKKALEGNKPKLIIADGPKAQEEVARLIKGSSIPIVNIERKRDHAKDMKDASVAISKYYSEAKISGGMANIPRSHLPYEARIWEGTSGDRVISAVGKFRGIAFAEVAPAWAWKQKMTAPKKGMVELGSIEKKVLEDNGLPLPGETMPEYLKRTNCLSTNLRTLLIAK